MPLHAELLALELGPQPLCIESDSQVGDGLAFYPKNQEAVLGSSCFGSTFGLLAKLLQETLSKLGWKAC